MLTVDSTVSNNSCLLLLPTLCCDIFLQYIFRTWWFDPFLATVGFAFFINWYWYHERKLGLSRDGSFQDTVQQWSSPAATTSSSTGICNSVIHKLGPLFQSLLAYWIGIYLWTSVIPPAAAVIPDGFPHSINELGYLVVEVVTGLVLYDAIFFFIHWALHEMPCLRFLHARHHEQQQQQQQHASASIRSYYPPPPPPPPVESRDVLRHSLVDGALQVGVNIFVQRRTFCGSVKTRLARAIHNILVLWMLTESHSAAPTPWIWRRWCVGVREHYQHHTTSWVAESETVTDSANDDKTSSSMRQRGRYQQFFGYLDELRWMLGKRMD